MHPNDTHTGPWPGSGYPTFTKRERRRWSIDWDLARELVRIITFIVVVLALGYLVLHCGQVIDVRVRDPPPAPASAPIPGAAPIDISNHPSRLCSDATPSGGGRRLKAPGRSS